MVVYMNILLVDDDRFVLGALNQNMDWKALGLTEVYNASNISQAKEVIRDNSIQILITDIEMPQGTGIDLLTWIREENYDIQTIFLTNYADFTFAQKAVQLQSLEYYLKPIEFNKLETIVKKAIKKVEATTQAKKAANISNMWEDIKANISEHFWSAYLKRDNAYTLDELKSHLKKNHLSIPISDQFNIILFDLYTIGLTDKNEITYCYPNPQKVSSGFVTAFHEIFHDLLSTHDILLDSNSATGTSFIAIINCNKLLDFNHTLKSSCDKLIKYINMKYNASLSCYIGLPVTFQTFHTGLKQLQSMSENIIKCKDTVFSLAYYTPVKAEYSLPNLNLLDEYLQLEKRNFFLEYCEDFLHGLSASNRLNHTVLVSFEMDVIQLIYSYLKEKGILAHKLLHGNTNDTLLELSHKSIENMLLYISYIVNTSLDYAAFSASEKSVASIICEYIDLHFNEDINRNSLAEIVYLDTDYTAKLFKKETGISLINYIIQKRIDTAKDLLNNTTLSVNQISDKVGYGNYSYFTKLFKKETGYTPMDYRKVKS